MRYRTLGKTGLTVSELGFGCGNVGGLMTRGQPDEQRSVVARALEGGITYFDTAASYGDGRSEENLGRTLRDLGAWERVVVGTKVNLSRDALADPRPAVRDSLTQSLRRLGRDSVDLLQLHSRIGNDPNERSLPPGEVAGAVAEAMRALVREGLVRHAGITGLGETEAVLEVVRSGAFDTVQAYFNALNPSAAYAGASGGAQDLGGLIAEAARAGMGVIAIRVLAAGAVSGSSERARLASPGGGGAMVRGGEFEADLRRAQSLADVARRHGLESTVELGLRFALAAEGVSTALVGFSDIEQVESALRWTARGPLAPGAVGEVVALARG
ncbi:MAG TPA: aldo/keto reductase [Dehalococcoidia bacterium]|nr:aldo/keto reductase [Dehalococcoidia bacterium]